MGSWKHTNPADAAVRVRSEFLKSEGRHCAQIAASIEEMIADGRLLEADLRAAWGMNPGQWNTYRNGTIKPLAAAFLAVRNARGS